MPPRFFRRRSGDLGSPEKKAPLVRPNFAHLGLACHPTPDTSSSPATRASSNLQHLSVSIPGESAHFEAIRAFSSPASPPQSLESHCLSFAQEPSTLAPRHSRDHALFRLDFGTSGNVFSIPYPGGIEVVCGEHCGRDVSTRNATNGKVSAATSVNKNVLTELLRSFSGSSLQMAPGEPRACALLRRILLSRSYVLAFCDLP